MKKILSLLLAAMMVLALCACGGNEAPAPAEAPAAEAPAAEAPAAEAPAAEAPAAEGDDFTQWKAYLREYVVAGAPSEEAAQSVTEKLDAAATPEEVEAIAEMTVMFSDVGVLHFQDWVAAGKPVADTSNMSGPPSGEPSGEPTEEPAN